MIAELSELGFEGFLENENGVSAFINSEENRSDLLKQVSILNSPEFEISWETKEIEPENWNAKWEKNFEPINIDGICTIRAPFHKKPAIGFDLVIEPKMAFGTGHHATTYLMAQFILQHNLNNKTVLDMGCGTGVLAILAEKKGALKIDAIDIDPNSYSNTLENSELNHCERIQVHQGGANLLKGKKYDCIFANINRNVLLEDMEVYEKSLLPKGILLLSGFLKADLNIVRQSAEKHGLLYKNHLQRDGWLAVKFVK